MSDTFTEDQIAEIDKQFKKLAKNNDTIKASNCIKLAQLLGQNPSQRQDKEALEACELNSSDDVDLETAMAYLWSVWREMSIEEELRAAFSKFDKNKNGFLEFEEFATAMKTLGEPLSDDELKSLMTSADLDGDGRINIDEYIQMMTETENENGEDAENGEDGGNGENEEEEN